MTRGEAAKALVRCGRDLWIRGHASGTSGNLSARLDDGTMLCSRTGGSLGSLDIDDFAVIDIASGEVLTTHVAPTIERPLHLTAYRTDPRVRWVVHTHPTYCVVWSCNGRMFPRDTVAANESLAAIGWVPYFPPGSQELADGVARVVAEGIPLALLENHGLIAATAELERAFLQTDLAEQCAMTAYHAAMLREALGAR